MNERLIRIWKSNPIRSPNRWANKSARGNPKRFSITSGVSPWKGDPPAKARGRACRYERVIKPLEICEIYHTAWASQYLELLASNVKMSVGSCIIPYITTNERRSANGYQTLHNRKPTCRKKLSLKLSPLFRRNCFCKTSPSNLVWR